MLKYEIKPIIVDTAGGKRYAIIDKQGKQRGKIAAEEYIVLEYCDYGAVILDFLTYEQAFVLLKLLNRP